jgi:hypothetical protein
MSINMTKPLSSLPRFSQNTGKVYHYSHCSLVPLYEVVCVGTGGVPDPSSIREWRKFTINESGMMSFVEGNDIEMAFYDHRENKWSVDSKLDVGHTDTVGIGNSSRLVFHRLIESPVTKFVQESGLEYSQKVKDFDLAGFDSFLHGWVSVHPYTLPALRIAEICWQRVYDGITTKRISPIASLYSLPAAHPRGVQFKEIGHLHYRGAGRDSSIADYEDGSRGLAKTTNKLVRRKRPHTVNPEVYVGSKWRERADLVLSLFFPTLTYTGFRADGNKSNDRIENLIRDEDLEKVPMFSIYHHNLWRRSRDYRADGTGVLPQEAYFDRWWRYGLNTYPFDIDV